MRLCLDGLWRIVIVDDYFPVNSFGNLVFSKVKVKSHDIKNHLKVRVIT